MYFLEKFMGFMTSHVFFDKIIRKHRSSAHNLERRLLCSHVGKKWMRHGVENV